MKNGKLMLVDGNSILNRAFYALKGGSMLATSDGTYVNGVYGFINILYKYMEEEKPDYLGVAFDLKGPTFRHKEFSDYKANRKGMPEELAMQVPIIKEVLDCMNIKRLEYEGFEADDILGSVSRCAEEQGLEVVILTGDRDSLQLASETTRIKLPVTRGKSTDTEEYDYNKVIERYGITPSQFIDVKGLMGDPSDNIPGVPGIGEKTALELIKTYGSIDNVFNNIDNIKKPSIRKNLIEYKEQAFLSRKLACIDRQMPQLCKIEELKIKEFNNERLYKLFTRLEFKSMIEKFGLEEKVSSEAPKIELWVVNHSDDLISLKKRIIESGMFSIFPLIDRINNFESKIIGAGISCDEDKACYISLNGNLKEDDFLINFKDILENENIKKIGHDLKSLLVYLKKKDIELKGLAFDTMIAAYLINPSRDTYTVSELAGEYLESTITSVEDLAGKGKNFVHFSNMKTEIISPAAAAYADAILKLYPRLDSLIIQCNQRELYYEIELPLVEVLADMENWGFKIDTEKLKKLSGELQEKIDLLTQEIYMLAGEQFNINSTKQLGVILFEKLKLPILKKTKTGYSTDAEVLEELSDRHEIVSKILEYRQLVKLKSTYVDGLLPLINPYTGRIHSSFNQTVTSTGRISSTEPNLQNIPIKLVAGREIRKVFIPDGDEYILSDADYSQIELRVLAHITGDENMIKAFVNNEDIHTSTAASVFGVPIKKVTPIMRSNAKAVNFGIVYGISDFSLAKDLGITRKEARRYIDGYLSRYPKVKQYMHDIVAEASEKGYVTTLFNRRRYLPELKSKNYTIRSFGERVALNAPIQGSAADIIKIAMVKVYKELKARHLRSRLILQVHDELIVETHINEKEEVEDIIKECMENAAILKVPLVVEVKTGKSWFETK
ncbi:MAG TPA: DNA polymerase I [Clostridiaceae bacterium]|nr:DNA polymerase I [Clostridiaceae bacterium]